MDIDYLDSHFALVDELLGAYCDNFVRNRVKISFTIIAWNMF